MRYRIAYNWITRGRSIYQVFFGTLEQWNKHAERLGVHVVLSKRRVD